MSATSEPGELAESDIVAFLNRHPQFFVNHTELLETLYIPHRPGAAISLVEKQMHLLRERNRRLQHQLDDLLDIARDNDKLFQRLHQLTLSLLEADDFEMALASLRDSLHQCFDADFFALRIYKRNVDAPLAGIFLEPPAIDPFADQHARQKPLCGNISPGQKAFLFGADADRVASCAVIPLRCGYTAGLLGIGSRDAERFHPAMGHLLLNRLGEIVAARLSPLLRED